MLLSEVSKIGGLDVIRDAPFQTLGFLSNPEPGMLVFVEDERCLALLERTPEAVCVITTAELAHRAVRCAGCATSASPRRSFHLVHSHLANCGFYWSDFKSAIHPSARIHPRAYIAEKNVRIGPGTQIGPNASIMERSLLGADVVIGPGVVIGSVGFQSGRFDGRLEEMVHAGGITIADRAHILANAVVASALFGQPTQIGADVRIGNCAFVSHNVRIGKASYIGHGAVVNGSVSVGEEVWVGPGASLVHGTRIGDHAHIAIGSVVIGNVEPGQKVAGNFAIEQTALLKHLASIR
ncbi:MAG TPA: DapH/DapD/GlmU-related protein [Terriglobales bacterium]|nr:DapH/DapD/GlmU-related protein [Terriglobales bacterium]